jgi:hypothetical protein
MQEAYLKASNNQLGLAPQFGTSVAISSNTIVVGVPAEYSGATGVNGNEFDASVPNSDAACVFVRSGTNWTQQAYLKASNTGNGDNFGSAVSISGDTIIVGAYNEDSNATGVNGNQTNNAAGNSGAAYVFAGLGVGPHLSFSPDGSGGYYLRFNGIPDLSYRLQRASDVVGPWSNLATQTASLLDLLNTTKAFRHRPTLSTARCIRNAIGFCQRVTH